MEIDEQAQAEIGRIAQTLKIIVFALASGVFAFAMVVLFQGLPDPQVPLGMLTLISLFFAFGAIAASMVVPRVIATTMVRQIAEGKSPASSGGTSNSIAPETTAGKLAAVYPTKTIIACALLEGAAFFALVALMFEGHIVALVLAAVLFIAILLHFPTTGRVTDWVERQLRFLDEQRHLSR